MVTTTVLRTTLIRALGPSLLTGVVLLTLSDSILAECPCNYTPATLIKVIDAETAWFDIQGKKTRVHLWGIHSPAKAAVEDHSPGCAAEVEQAHQAEQFVRQLLASAKRIQLDIKDTEGEGEGDTQAVIYVDGLSVGQELLYRYLAIEYGDDRSFWCRPKEQ
ncbi:uncharacterized protein METZ01_LOCUS507865 [marine metagenome]|uniref:TNase-like domain-containing protein n=1 Tax=marine metagenome TaxID=408172 RepID=A0A383EE57_9ZZZZ